MKITKQQIIKGHKKTNRELELDNGFKNVNKIHKSKKTYTRKLKHK